jgi:hypothetical protein
MPKMNAAQPQRNSVDNANSGEPTRTGESQIHVGEQACMYFLHNCGLIDLMKT